MKNGRVMKCPSPPLADSLRNVIRSKRSEVKRRKQKEVKVVQLGFIMDGVVSLQNLSFIPDMNSQLYYYTNPRVFNFTEAGGIMKLKGENLIIEVKSQSFISRVIVFYFSIIKIKKS